ncbi:MAG TPA: Flp pilus assembly protein CpaB [Candidatus Dormibacteraeota bacterium]|nr:Flp pilus assembly protein CpaB [Candidatus Dormibacteraeota bacterium]
MRRPIIFILLAGLGAILAAIVVFSALRNRESEVQRAMAHTVEVVVAARDIPLGEKVQPDAVKLVRWARDGVPQGSFTDPNAVVGSFAKNQFVANEPVVVSKLFMGEKTSGVMPLLIPAGMRAMSVPVDEVADIAGFVAPHTHVDILAAVSGTGPGESSFSRIVLQNIEVLAVAQEIEHVKDEPQVVKVVTLLVTPTDAEKLTLASREGTLRLAMRNYSDSKIIATNGVAMADLMHNGAGAVVPLIQPQPIARPAHLNADGRTPLRVEVMRDGKSSEAISFLNSGKVRNSHDQSRDHTPAIAVPPGPAADRAPDVETPVSNSATGAAATLAGAPENPFAASRPGSNEDSSINRAAPTKQGEPGYQAAPKTYLVQ